MRREKVKNIVLYYRNIPGMEKLLRKEQSELLSEYDGLHAPSMDGMPHGSTPGMPTEALALRTAESGAYIRLQEIDVQLQTLAADAAMIRGCLDTLSDKYKRLIFMRYLYGYSWTRISVRISAPDSTVRSWHGKAMERMGEALEEVPMVDELAQRASRART